MNDNVETAPNPGGTMVLLPQSPPLNRSCALNATLPPSSRGAEWLVLPNPDGGRGFPRPGF